MQYDLIKSIYGYRRRSIRQECFSMNAKHMHESCEIYLFLQGDVCYFVENKKFMLKPYDMLLFNNRELHMASVLSDGIYDRYVIHFPPQLIRTLCTGQCNLLSCFYDREVGEGNFRHLTPTQGSRMMSMLDKLYAMLLDDSIFSNMLTLSTLIELLVEINGIYDKPLHDIPQIAVSQVVDRVINYVNNNLDGDLSLDTIAAAHFVDKSHLCRKFKAECGTTLHQYIISKRLMYAKELLGSGKNVTEVCIMSGFNDYSNFMRVFKKATGTTPMEFTREYQGMGNGLKKTAARYSVAATGGKS